MASSFVEMKFRGRSGGAVAPELNRGFGRREARGAATGCSHSERSTPSGGDQRARARERRGKGEIRGGERQGLSARIVDGGGRLEQSHRIGGAQQRSNARRSAHHDPIKTRFRGRVRLRDRQQGVRAGAGHAL